MKILIDGYNLALDKGTGVATYARNLSHCLGALGHQVGVLYGGSSSERRDELLKEIAFFDPDLRQFPPWLRAWRAVKAGVMAPMGHRATEVPITGKVISEGFKARMPHCDQILNAQDLYRRGHSNFRFWKRMGQVQTDFKPQITHWTYPLPLYVKGSKNIYTLHDLVPLRLPYTTLDDKRHYLQLCRSVVQRADHIVTVSEASRRDIIELLGIAPDKVSNTYQSVSIADRYRKQPVEVVQRELAGTFGLKYRGYFLFYGSIEPKKNIGRLIEAYLGSAVDTPLVIVGAQAWKSEQELRLLFEDHIRYLVTDGGETHVKRRVMQLDYVPFALLVSLIRGAKATLFPSIYEGFGLPVLESMLLGTPVLSSNTSSVPEVAGDAACLINPYDTREMAEAIRELDHNEAMRAELSAKGLQQAKLFDEAAHMKRVQAVYDQVSRR